MSSDRSFSPANSISTDTSLSSWVTECSPEISSTKRRWLEFVTVMASRMGFATVGGKLWSMARASNFQTCCCVYIMSCQMQLCTPNQPKVRGSADNLEG